MPNRFSMLEATGEVFLVDELEGLLAGRLACRGGVSKLVVNICSMALSTEDAPGALALPFFCSTNSGDLFLARS